MRGAPAAHTMLPLLALATSAFALVAQPSGAATNSISRRSWISFAGSAALGAAARPVVAAENNEAEQKLRVILAQKVKEREAMLGFQLDAEDIRELENVLRNKYCGPSGAFSGEPGGTCAESPRAEATCFKVPGFESSCSKSYGS